MARHLAVVSKSGCQSATASSIHSQIIQSWGGVGLGDGCVEVVPMSLGGGGLLAGGLAIGALVDVPVGFVPLGFVLLGFVLPGWHGLATVADVPVGREPVPEATVELLAVPLLGPVVVAVPVDAVPVALLLLDGVHGAVVAVVPVWFCEEPWVPPVTVPGLPATPGVPCVTAGEPVGIAPG
jgi:hypothetical protein